MFKHVNQLLNLHLLNKGAKLTAFRGFCCLNIVHFILLPTLVYCCLPIFALNVYFFTAHAISHR